jgi:hypothetical protein
MAEAYGTLVSQRLLSGGGGNRMPGDSDHPLSAFTVSSDFQTSLECDACQSSLNILLSD